MNIVNFNKERYKETKKFADDLLKLCAKVDNGLIAINKEEVSKMLHKLEWEYRQKAFEYQSKL